MFFVIAFSSSLGHKLNTEFHEKHISYDDPKGQIIMQVSIITGPNIGFFEVWKFAILNIKKSFAKYACERMRMTKSIITTS